MATENTIPMPDLTITNPSPEAAAPVQPEATAPVQPEAAAPAAPTTDDPLGTGEPTSQPSWLDSLPEDLRKNEKLLGFKSVEELAKAHADSQPAPTIPEADAYKLPESFPIKDIGKWANKVGLTQQQLEHIINLDNHLNTERMNSVDKVYAAGLNTLYTEWGEAKTENIRLAKAALSHFDDTGELKTMLNASKAGNHPVVVNFFAKLGKKLMKEDWFVANGGNSNSGTEISAADTIFDGK